MLGAEEMAIGGRINPKVGQASEGAIIAHQAAGAHAPLKTEIILKSTQSQGSSTRESFNLAQSSPRFRVF